MAKQRPLMPPPTITISSSWCTLFPSALKMCPFSPIAINEVQGELVGFINMVECEKEKFQVLGILHIHAFKIHIMLVGAFEFIDCICIIHQRV
jgi:hypothetical protein